MPRPCLHSPPPPPAIACTPSLATATTRITFPMRTALPRPQAPDVHGPHTPRHAHFVRILRLPRPGPRPRLHPALARLHPSQCPRQQRSDDDDATTHDDCNHTITVASSSPLAHLALARPHPSHSRRRCVDDDDMAIATAQSPQRHRHHSPSRAHHRARLACTSSSSHPWPARPRAPNGDAATTTMRRSQPHSCHVVTVTAVL